MEIDWDSSRFCGGLLAIKLEVNRGKTRKYKQKLRWDENWMNGGKLVMIVVRFDKLIEFECITEQKHFQKCANLTILPLKLPLPIATSQVSSQSPSQITIKSFHIQHKSPNSPS
jgi:hypothetical protein